MSGMLMNLTSLSDQNVFLNADPTKSYFCRKSYKKYTNFGKQNMRIDYTGTPILNLTVSTGSTYSFTIKRYGDFLMDAYICITLPNIWSPIFPPQAVDDGAGGTFYTSWAPYEFQWIDFIGAQIIKKVTITCGNQTLQHYSGQYILAAAQRDYSAEKLQQFYEMIGHVPEMNNPASAGARSNVYPSAFYTPSAAGAQYSIQQRQLYIPLGSWFSLLSNNAFPLVACQGAELVITVEFRPVMEWFTIRDVMDWPNNYPIVAPNFNEWWMQFYRFRQTPPDVELGPTSYVNRATDWNADIHLNCTYAVVANEERSIIVTGSQRYLFRQVVETPYNNLSGSSRILLEKCLGQVASWMFFLRRSDANLRNQWSNYTNWPYGWMPLDVTLAPVEGDYVNPDPTGGSEALATLGPGVNPDGTETGLYITGVYNPQNLKEILVSMAILIDGNYRENMLDAGVYNYVEKFTRTAGNAPSGLYCYNFCLNTSPYVVQPSGAINMNRFAKVQFEIVTIAPMLDPFAQSLQICDPRTQQVVAINKPSWRIYDYTYDLFLMEERYNFVEFLSGIAGLVWATA